MAHVFALVEARKLWMDIFIHDLTERRYPYEAMNGEVGFSQPNIREIKLLNISVPETSLPHLYADLAPFTKSSPQMPSPLKNKVGVLTRAIKVAGGLKSIYPEEDAPICWKDVPLFVPSFAKLFKLADDLPFVMPRISELKQAKPLIKEVKELPSNIPYISWFANKIEKIPFIGKRLVTSKKKAWSDFVECKINEVDNRIDAVFKEFKHNIKVEKDKLLDKDVKETPYVGKDLDKVFRIFRDVETAEIYEPSDALRRAWVNVMPIGWKEDLHDPKGTFPGLPKGGELL